MEQPQQHANWIAQARAHWKEHQPKRFKALVKAGTLQTALQAAAQDTSREMENLRGQGIPPEAAWEMVRERHLFPPEEPGNSPEAPPSDGYRIAAMANQGLGQIRMPSEPEDLEYPEA